MSCSGRLVTQMNKFESLDPDDPIRSSKKFSTFSRADGVPVVFGHSSRASMIRKMGSCSGSSIMRFKHPARATSLGCSAPLRLEVYSL